MPTLLDYAILDCTVGTSDKVYVIARTQEDPFEFVHVWFGRRGAGLQYRSYDFGSVGRGAAAFMQDKLDEKRGKRYQACSAQAARLFNSLSGAAAERVLRAVAEDARGLIGDPRSRASATFPPPDVRVGRPALVSRSAPALPIPPAPSVVVPATRPAPVARVAPAPPVRAPHTPLDLDVDDLHVL